MSKIRLLIADDHPLFLEGLCTILPLKDPRMIVVGAVENGREVIRTYEETNPDVVLLDIKMPDMDGIEAAKQIRNHDPDAKIVMLTTFSDRQLVCDALTAGAKGYILKTTPVQQVVEDIKTVYNGNLLMSGGVVEELRGSLRVDAATRPANEIPREAYVIINRMPELNAKEREILSLMVRDLNNQQIADRLFLSEKTVRNYVSHIYGILGIHDRAGVRIWLLDQVDAGGRRNPVATPDH